MGFFKNIVESIKPVFGKKEDSERNDSIQAVPIEKDEEESGSFVTVKNCGIDPYVSNGSKFNIANVGVTFAVKNDDGEISEIAKITDIGSVSKNGSVYGLFLVLSEEKNKCSKVGIKVETGKLPCKWRMMSGHLLLDGVSGSDYNWFDVDGNIVIKSDMQLIISA